MAFRLRISKTSDRKAQPKGKLPDSPAIHLHPARDGVPQARQTAGHCRGARRRRPRHRGGQPPISTKGRQIVIVPAVTAVGMAVWPWAAITPASGWTRGSRESASWRRMGSDVGYHWPWRSPLGYNHLLFPIRAFCHLCGGAILPAAALLGGFSRRCAVFGAQSPDGKPAAARIGCPTIRAEWVPRPKACGISLSPAVSASCGHVFHTA